MEAFSHILKDYRLLKFIFTIWALYLIIETIYIFLVVKPTYTSHEKRELSADDFPEIIMCPEPSIDLKAVKSKGYGAPDAYFKGYFHGFQYFSWAGNNLEDVKKVSEEVSMLKSIDDCPVGSFRFKDVDGRHEAKFQLTKGLNPYHTCCKIIPPKLSHKHPIISIRISLPENSSVRSFKVSMADELTASFYEQHKTILMGDKIVSPDKDGAIFYKAKILEEQNLENDPNYPCVLYKTIGEYGKCVESEMLRQNFDFLNCTPPWMTLNEELWCQGKHYVDSEVSKSYFDFLSDISASEGNYGKCSVPCQVKRYPAKEIGFKENSLRGLTIRFEKVVDITKSSWTIDERTLLSKIGGFIGISKNFLWLIILLISSISVLFSHAQKFDK